MFKRKIKRNNCSTIITDIEQQKMKEIDVLKELQRKQMWIIEQPYFTKKFKDEIWVSNSEEQFIEVLFNHTTFFNLTMIKAMNEANILDFECWKKKKNEE